MDLRTKLVKAFVAGAKAFGVAFLGALGGAAFVPELLQAILAYVR